jgi:acetyl esterase/lipase
LDPQPFVLTVTPTTRERIDNVDVYRPPTDGPSPIIVFVHGGPVPAGVHPTPREHPIFVGYGSLAAANGAVGVMFDHRFHSAAHLEMAAADVASAVDRARELPGVDADRVVLWFFSGGGLLAADWLRDPPPWLRGIAATYPILDVADDWGVDPRFRPVEAVASADRLPILLTRVGLERPDFAAGVEAFIAEARAKHANLEIIDVPNGHHGFDGLDYTQESRDAVSKAMSLVVERMLAPTPLPGNS